eukprot:SAG11_NODE_5755_length_1470_cov_12.811816_2_plen_97_part_00
MGFGAAPHLAPRGCEAIARRDREDVRRGREPRRHRPGRDADEAAADRRRVRRAALDRVGEVVLPGGVDRGVVGKVGEHVARRAPVGRRLQLIFYVL